MLVVIDDTSATCSPPSGWNLFDSGVVGDVSWFLYRKDASSEPGTYTINYTPSVGAGAGLVAAGGHQSVVEGARTPAANSTSCTGASVTIPAGTSNVVEGLWVGKIDSTGEPWDIPNAWTEEKEFSTNLGAGRNVAVSCGRYTGLTNGDATGDQVATSAVAGDNVGVLFAFSDQPITKPWVMGVINI
jgi:hypothetical protein